MKLRFITASLLCTTFLSGAYAQSTTGSGMNRGATTGISWIPYTTLGYVGVNLGKPNFKGDCVGGFSCNNSNFGGKIYTGGLLQEYGGLEIGYVNLGSADRFGGTQRAQGISLTLIGNLPMSDVMHLTGRVGTAYMWTKTSTAPLTPVVNGDNNSFGLTYGIGFGFDVTQQNQISIDWDRHRVEFAPGKQNVDLISVGWKYKF
jgi:OmpA-OmpF porin, OOP family